MTTNEVDLKITNIITDYWINFAKTGDPNGENIPTWPMFNTDNLVQSFGNNVRTIPSTEPILCKLYAARDNKS
jgi:para-nitrobenzyl esterase